MTANVHVWTLHLPVNCSTQSLVNHWKMLIKYIHCLTHWSALPVNQIPGLLILKSFFNHSRNEVISITVSFVSLIYTSFLFACFCTVLCCLCILKIFFTLCFLFIFFLIQRIPQLLCSLIYISPDVHVWWILLRNFYPCQYQTKPWIIY